MFPGRKYLALTLVTLVLTFTQLSCESFQSNSDQPSPEEKVAMYAKPAVVRVSNGCIADFRYTRTDSDGKTIGTDRYPLAYGLSGTGFFINSDGYIATYAVTTEEDCKERLYKNLAIQAYKSDPNHVFDPNDVEFVKKNSELLDFEYINNVILPARDLKADPNDPDRIPKFQVKAPGGPLNEGEKDVAIIKIDVKDAPSLRLIEDSTKVKLDAITVVGYPWVDTTANTYEKVLKSDAVYEASVSPGRISNSNKKLKNNTPVLEINMLSAYGSAGSPILNDQGEVIGIVAPTEADRNPFASDEESNVRSRDRGIPLAMTANTIQEFVNDSGARNEPGKIDEYYRGGLDLFWKGDFGKARERFVIVKDLFPQHSEVERLINESNAGTVDLWFKPAYIFWSLITAIVLGTLGFVFFYMQRKSRLVTSPVGSSNTSTFPRMSPTGFPSRNNGIGEAYLDLEGQGEFRQLSLNQETHRIGRDPAWSDIEIPMSWEVLSRHHALLKRENGSYRIFDGDGKVPSRNGIMVNGYTSIDATQGYLLKPGDVLTIGRDLKEQVRLTYYNSAASQVTPETKMAK